jgi:hypothetical protein
MERIKIMDQLSQSQNSDMQPSRCIIVIDQNLPIGRSANAAAVMALTVGARHPRLVGGPLVDASGFNHPGLIPIGISILAAPCEALNVIRQKGLSAGCDVVDFPVEGQQTNNYETFQEAVLQIPPDSISYTGVALIGEKKTINKIVGSLKLLR